MVLGMENLLINYLDDENVEPFEPDPQEPEPEEPEEDVNTYDYSLYLEDIISSQETIISNQEVIIEDLNYTNSYLKFTTHALTLSIIVIVAIWIVKNIFLSFF